MTILDAYRAVLIELNKVQAPSILLEDFVYLFNKAIQLYINKKYNLFESNQLATDDLRVLIKSSKITNLPAHSNEDLFGSSYDCVLPSDYMHILNCICEFLDKNPRCNDCDRIRVGANKLTTDLWSLIISNYYMRPSIKRPYYYIINIEDPKDNTEYNSDKEDGKRYGNSSLPVMLIKCGNDRKGYELKAVYVDYLRTPKYVELTLEQIDKAFDTSQLLEFNDYVVDEIINETVKLIMENAGNPRLQSNVAVNQTIPPQVNR